MEYEYDMSRKPVAQGDVMLIPITAVPDGAQPEKSTRGQFIVTHSESGHNHVVMERPDIQMFKGMDIFNGFLKMDFAADLIHLRDHHTHAPITLEPGAYVIKRQRQPTPEGWKRAVD